ncbi:MAG TPA: hypothetical protein VIM41_00805 [Gammaproteobacteria bacterium]
MLHTNGIPPKLTGRECEALICQQYWQSNKLLKEVDVLYIKSNGRWYQLYFENSTIFWRSQTESPAPYIEKENDPFRYPLVDLGSQYQVKGAIIAEYEEAPMAGGVKVTLVFERGDKIIVTCIDNKTAVQHIKAL